MTPLQTSGKAVLQPSMDKTMPVTDIVLNDYRTADVFLKYDIEFCCGGKWPLEMVCESKKLDVDHILHELKQVSTTLQLPEGGRFDDWSTGFLIDFIENIYHRYLKQAPGASINHANRFLEGHLKKFPELETTPQLLAMLSLNINKRITNEVESFFPYIRQVTNAYQRNESYAGLLVKTLRKPWQDTVQQEYKTLTSLLEELRSVTHHYFIPGNACVTHRVTFSKLGELDRELTQYLYLEHELLFPRVAAVEKALLA
jgi:regulator of cell morphogenesis and NO signaling